MIVEAWARKEDFFNVCQISPIEEGLVARMINAVGHVCKEMAEGAKLLGNEELAAKMEEAQALMQRDIIFCPSLYLD